MIKKVFILGVSIPAFLLALTFTGNCKKEENDTTMMLAAATVAVAASEQSSSSCELSGGGSSSGVPFVSADATARPLKFTCVVGLCMGVDPIPTITVQVQ